MKTVYIVANNKTRKSLEARNAPQMPIDYKKADLVIKHHLYTKQTTFYEK